VHKFFTIIFYSFLLNVSSFVFAEEQKEDIKKPSSEQSTTKNTTQNKPTNTKPEQVAPVELIEQQQEDLKHYLNVDEVKPLLAGPDAYITLIKKNANANSKGVAILLPDWQQSATNPKAFSFLRASLPDKGWTTITLQPPNKPKGYPSTALLREDKIKENKELIDEYQRKQKVMFNALMNQAKEYPGIVIVIAQGNNAALLVNLFSENEDNNDLQVPNAMVLLSSYRQTSNELINKTNEIFASQLASIELPILDLYLQHDHPLAIAKAPQRKSFANQEMKVYYRQRQLNNNAAGYYPEQELLSQINRWLQSIGW
jgi:hypothetical protein